MKKLIYFFRDKWFKKTISTIILSALLICIFLLINIIAIKIDATPLDFTKEKRYSLSEESKRIAREVKQNVNMYFFGYEDDSEYVRLAKQYENENSKIKVQVVSFISNPDLATTFGVNVNDTINPIQAATLSRGNQPNTTAKAVIAISIVAKNRIFLTISASFLIRTSVRKIFCAAVTIRTSRNSSSKVAVDKPEEPKENNVDTLPASFPMIRLMTMKIMIITPYIENICPI